MKDISERSGVSPQQIMKAMALDASESVLRRIDAFLDAKNLHKLQKDSVLLREIENLTYELWRFWNEKSLPMTYIYPMPLEKQKRLKEAMHWRLKRLLRERIKKETGIEPRFSDGSTYWLLKAQFYDGETFSPYKRKLDRGSWKGSVGKGTQLQSRKNTFGKH